MKKNIKKKMSKEKVKSMMMINKEMILMIKNRIFKFKQMEVAMHSRVKCLIYSHSLEVNKILIKSAIKYKLV